MLAKAETTVNMGVRLFSRRSMRHPYPNSPPAADRRESQGAARRGHPPDRLHSFLQVILPFIRRAHVIIVMDIALGGDLMATRSDLTMIPGWILAVMLLMQK